MQTKADAELLREYVANKSEAAFGEIVRRYADFVYSAALRQMGNTEQARDVAQIVFTDFARKASSLKNGTVLIGWFSNAARLAALEQIRTDQRRLQRERQSMDFAQSSSDTTDDWTAVRPVLDEALAQLGNEDRDALLLRFFKNESLAAVGATLGVSEDAAQKRVSRALGRLREFLAERGINTTAALSASLIANGVEATPGGFAASLAAGALKSAASANSLTAPLLKLFSASNLKAAAVVVALAAGVAWMAQRQAKLQRDLHDAQALTQQRMAELDSLRATNAQLALQADELERLRSDAKDVLRLRAEVTDLRQRLAEEKVVTRPHLAAVATNVFTPVPQIINVRCKFLSIPADYDAPATGILTEPQFKTVLKAMEEKKGAEVLDESQVTTLNGREAQIQALANTIVNGGRTNIGAMLDFIATCDTNSPSAIRLNLAAEARALVDLSSQQDGSLLALESSRFTNSLVIPDGHTLVMLRKLPFHGRWTMRLPGTNIVSEPRALIVFVTPTQIDPAGNRIHTEEESPQGSTPGNPARAAIFSGSVPGLSATGE